MILPFRREKTFEQAIADAKKGCCISRPTNLAVGAYLQWDPLVKFGTERGGLILNSELGGQPCRWHPVPGDAEATDWIAIVPREPGVTGFFKWLAESAKEAWSR